MLLSLPVLARTQTETPAVMLQAAEARLRECEVLLAAQQWDGAVYLAGYVAEMLLKVAFCNLDRAFSASDDVSSAFGLAVSLWRGPSRSIPLPPQYKHSLLFWETVLRSRRALLSTGPIEWGSALILSRHLTTIGQHWQVGLRYQAPLVTGDEAQQVCRASRWLFDNRLILWS